jgi:hypothetical protein
VNEHSNLYYHNTIMAKLLLKEKLIDLIVKGKNFKMKVKCVFSENSYLDIHITLVNVCYEF